MKNKILALVAASLLVTVLPSCWRDWWCCKKRETCCPKRECRRSCGWGCRKKCSKRTCSMDDDMMMDEEMEDMSNK